MQLCALVAYKHDAKKTRHIFLEIIHVQLDISLTQLCALVYMFSYHVAHKIRKYIIRFVRRSCARWLFTNRCNEQRKRHVFLEIIHVPISISSQRSCAHWYICFHIAEQCVYTHMPLCVRVQPSPLHRACLHFPILVVRSKFGMEILNFQGKPQAY